MDHPDFKTCVINQGQQTGVHRPNLSSLSVRAKTFCCSKAMLFFLKKPIYRLWLLLIATLNGCDGYLAARKTKLWTPGPSQKVGE